jgi:glycosyltransferase involved in cell wall biosynthesis
VGRGTSESSEAPVPGGSGAQIHVAWNLLFLVPGETGGLETYARHLMPALARAGAPEFRFTAVIAREAEGWEPLRRIEGVDVVELPVCSRRREQWILGEQFLVPRALRANGIDLLHNLTATGPLWPGRPQVTTVHDLIYNVVPESSPGLRGAVMRRLAPAVARRSERVITDSEASARDLERIAHLDASRVRVVPIAADTVAVVPECGPEEIRQRFQIGTRRLALCPGGMKPHKNVVRLLEALALMPRDRRPVLLLPGYSTGHQETLVRRCAELGLEGDVRFLGWVDDALLEALYAAADILIFPSLYEGFGLPVLEAMMRGVPVVCSNAASLPEVGGDAVRYFDPLDVAAMAAEITLVLDDGDLRARMAGAALERAGGFSWERAARETLEVYRTALASAREGATGGR